MKKILLFTFIFFAASVSTTALADKKKDKKKTQEPAAETVKPVVLTTTSDTVSYAAGLAATQGLLPYLERQLHVDTAYLADFVRGYKEAIAKANDPAYVAYIAGTNIAGQAANQILPNITRSLEGSPDSIQAALFHEGFLAGVQQDTSIIGNEHAAQLIQERVKEVQDKKNAAYKAENEQWLKDNASKPGVVTLPSGLQYKVLKTGTGAKPTKDQTVEVIYEGKTIDGNVFDATSRHNGQKTDKFRCDQVIKGWTEALTSMNVGSKWEIYIPQELAYGERQAGQIKPYSTLIFTVELVGIEAPKTTTAKPATAAKKPVKTTARKK